MSVHHLYHSDHLYSISAHEWLVIDSNEETYLEYRNVHYPGAIQFVINNTSKMCTFSFSLSDFIYKYFNFNVTPIVSLYMNTHLA